MKSRMMPVRAGDAAPRQIVLMPADHLAAEDFSEAGFKIGETLETELRRSRNPGYHRLVHALGKEAVRSIEEFESWNAHDVIKRFQVETGVGCTEILVDAGGMKIPYRIPKSIAFGSMAQDEFERLARAMALRLVKHYGHGATVEEMMEIAGQILEGNG